VLFGAYTLKESFQQLRTFMEKDIQDILQMLPASVRADRQVSYLAKELPKTREALVVALRWDDECRNGHNTFSVTGTLYRATYAHPLAIQWGTTSKGEPKPLGYTIDSTGCLHELILEHYPDLEKAIRYHLCTAKGPMHYLANTLYLAGDRDCDGYRKGDQRRNKAGVPLWLLSYEKSEELGFSSTVVAATTPPCAEAKAWILEGKARELANARRAACWPDAPDDALTADEETLKAALLNRLPSLMHDFKTEILRLGFVY
jgi:hypothetical protein